MTNLIKEDVEGIAMKCHAALRPILEGQSYEFILSVLGGLLISTLHYADIPDEAVKKQLKEYVISQLLKII